MSKIITSVFKCFIIGAFISCSQDGESPKQDLQQTAVKQVDTPEYFALRPEVEKAFGYSHAVRIGNDIKISGAVSMDDKGVPTAKKDMLQQMKN